MRHNLSMPFGALPRWLRLPPVAPGMRIGLYGGSFNPAHAGHRLVSELALQRLGLDRVWWMVSPGNPLKAHDGLPSTAERFAAARKVAASGRIDVTAFEEALGTAYTVETISFLKRRFPLVRFVWLMGADNLADFHRWRGWQDIAAMVPMAIIDRPGWTLKSISGRAATVLAGARLPENLSSHITNYAPPAWVFLQGPRNSLSSTELRMRKKATNFQ